MPEIKNTFLKGKMNKDLDERVLPKGEYRNAQNILINDSEDSDVGAIENVLGNKLKHDDINISNAETIGYYADTKTKNIYWFVTNFTGDTGNVLNMSRATNSNVCRVYMLSAAGELKTLVNGHFLNFSKAHLITGVNVIDNLLFWTDNYNQPRKINIDTAIANSAYYDSEEKISVAKVAPYIPPVLYNTSAAGDGTTLKTDANVKSDYLKENFVRFSYRYKFDDGEYSTIAPFTQTIFKPLNNGVISPVLGASNANSKNTTSGEPDVLITAEDIYKKGTVDIMENAYNFVELRIPLPNADEFKTTQYSPTTTYSNPYNIKQVEILLKESDGVAVYAVAKLVVNDSSFTNNIEQYEVKPVEISGQTDGAVSNSTTITIDANTNVKVGMQLTHPSGVTTVLTVNNTGTSITVADNVSFGDNATLTFFFRYYRQQLKYIYKSEKPYKVLPEDQTTRVYDQVPLRAKAQEVTGNRIVYGNFTENYNLPRDENNRTGINYLINASRKGFHEFSGGSSNTSGLLQHTEKTYKFNSIKQRRTYQVGVVLSDRFGRQSSVILSSNDEGTEGKSDTFTVQNDSGNKFVNGGHSWSSDEANIVGKALDIEFKDTRIVPESEMYSASNPYGWYSWRLVVKQTEQEYYNVYAPHPADDWNNIDNDKSATTSGRSWLTLYGDNINKVPRSVNDEDVTRPGVSGSEARLFPKVISDSSNTAYSKANTDGNDKLINVISIGNAKDQNLFLQATNDDFKGETSGTTGFSVLPFVYGSDRNPLVAELPNLRVAADTANSAGIRVSVFNDGSSASQVNVFRDNNTDFVNGSIITGPRITLDNINNPLTVTGASGSGTILVTYNGGDQTFVAKDLLFISNYKDGLSVFETEPFESKLDIYYGTATGGLINDLNKQMANITGVPSNLRYNDNSNSDTFAENTSSGTAITGGNLQATASGGGGITFQLLSAIRQNGDNVTGSFALSGSGALTTAADFARANDPNLDNITLTVRYTESGAGSTTDTLSLSISNSAPSVTSSNNTSGNPASVSVDAGGGTSIFSGTATNGAALSTANKTGLSYSVAASAGSQYNNYFAISSSVAGSYTVTTTSNYNGTTWSSLGNKNVVVTVTDAEGATGTHSVTINSIDTRVQSTFRTDSGFSVCTTGSDVTVWVEKGTGASLNANKLVVGNRVFAGQFAGTDIGLRQFRFYDAGYYYAANHTGSGGNFSITSITQCT